MTRTPGRQPSPLEQVLTSAAATIRERGVETGTVETSHSIIRRIYDAARLQTTDQAEADTLTVNAITFLAGQWRTPESPVARLTTWASQRTADEILALLANAATEVRWLVEHATAPTDQKAPVEQIEDAHRRRDFFGVIEAAQSGQRSLETQPWYPVRAGDVVHVAYSALPPHFPAHGETYLIEEPGAGWFSLRLIAHTRPESMGDAGDFATDGDPDPLMAMWFEAGPAVLTIVRDGRVVHGGA